MTWHDDHVHSYTCMTLLFVQKGHKIRLVVNQFVCSRRQMVSKLTEHRKAINYYLKSG